MKTIKLILVACAITLIACNTAKNAGEEKKRQQKKMDQMEKDKEDFKRKNEKDLN
jgi:predicted small secreted protein